MVILAWILLGLVAGWLASLIMGGRYGVLGDILLGIVGALVGGIVASAIGTGDIFELNFLGTIVGIVAAAVLIGVADRAAIGKGRRRDSLKPG